jgi:hypothetical protein
MDWTLDRIQTLTKPEVKQLRANAERLEEPGVVALCDEVLNAKAKPAGVAAKGVARSTKKPAKPRKESQGD